MLMSWPAVTGEQLPVEGTTNRANTYQPFHPLGTPARTKTDSTGSRKQEINNTILIKVKTGFLFCFALWSKCLVPPVPPPTHTHSAPSLTKLYLVGPEQAVLSKTQQLHDSHCQQKTGTWHKPMCTATLHTPFKRKQSILSNMSFCNITLESKSRKKWHVR